MLSNAAEWIVRTVMLVLAGLVTLSILGSIAAMSNDPANLTLRTAPDTPVLTPAPAPAPDPQPAEPVAEADQAPAPTPNADANTTIETGETVTVPAPPAEPAPERWLEAIAYALLAIAGLLALLLILLWRGVRALGRIADARALGQQRN
jgi:type V secretory pathway adhesin AidA